MKRDYRDDLKIRLTQAGIEPTDELIRFIDMETMPLRSDLFKKDRLLIEIKQLLQNGGHAAHTVFGRLYRKISDIV